MSLKPLLPRINYLIAEHTQLEQELSDPNVVNDLERYKTLGKAFAEKGEVVGAYREWQVKNRALGEAQTLWADAEKNQDADLASMAQDEINTLEHDLAVLEKSILKLLVPKDPDDHYHAILEIRAGTGGDESCLFAGDIYRMYCRYAERQRWKVEVLSMSEAEVGGYKEIIIRIEGKEVYGRLKFESGGHRVQRVPQTETQGRVHTSASTVAVLPEIPEQEIEINPADLRIDTYRASGAGGQHVNKTDSAVRITHLPSGLVVECQDDRSQHRNRARAMSVLAARLHEKQRIEAQKKEAQTRKLLVGSGERSDKIRTYNFPQSRMSDHRINLTLYKLAMIMDGDLDELLDALQLFSQNEMLSVTE